MFLRPSEAIPTYPDEDDLQRLDLLVRPAADLIERNLSDEALRHTERWQAGQKEAFRAAVDGAPLDVSLGHLARTAVEQFNGQAHCAFYLADAAGVELRHVVGMPEAYARCVEGFESEPGNGATFYFTLPA